jgi:hypothetical protein
VVIYTGNQTIKNMAIKTILKILAIWALLYFAFAFSLAELNPFEWSQDLRAGFAYCYLCTIVLTPMFEYLIKISK